MNHVSLMGNLTKDPELKRVGEDNRAVCEMRLAVNDGRQDRDPLYIDVVTFDKSAEACAKHLAKGRQIAVEGRLRFEQWKTEDDEPRSKHKVIGRVEFLGKPTSSDEAEAAEAAEAGSGEDEDIPF
jgi:single-strand DNA-binding protein